MSKRVRAIGMTGQRLGVCMALLLAACTPHATRGEPGEPSTLDRAQLPRAPAISRAVSANAPDASATPTVVDLQTQAAAPAMTSVPKPGSSASPPPPVASSELTSKSTSAPTALSRLQEPQCPCDDSPEQYLQRARRLSKTKDWAAAYQAFRAAAAASANPLPEANAGAAYCALRAGHPDVASELNRRAYVDAAGDTELRAKISFNQGLVELERQQALRAALLFDTSLELRDHDAVRARARGLPDVKQVCERPANAAELCACNSRDLGKQLDVLPMDVTTCEVRGEALDKRFVVVEQLSAADESMVSVAQLLLVENTRRGWLLQKYLEETHHALISNAEVSLQSMTPRTLHSRKLVTIRTSTTTYMKANAGMEHTVYVETSDVVCLADVSPARCSSAIFVRAEHSTTTFVDSSRPGSGGFEAIEDPPEFIEYDYLISADGWLNPKKKAGTLGWQHPPTPIRIW